MMLSTTIGSSLAIALSCLSPAKARSIGARADCPPSAIWKVTNLHPMRQDTNERIGMLAIPPLYIHDVDFNIQNVQKPSAPTWRCSTGRNYAHLGGPRPEPGTEFPDSTYCYEEKDGQIERSEAWFPDPTSGCPSGLEETCMYLLAAGFRPDSLPMLNTKLQKVPP